MTTDEIRIIDPETGGAKDQKPARFDLIPPGPLDTLARQYGQGAAKYGDRNWEQGYAWSLSFAAMQRHAWQFWNGEDVDPETGLPHLAAVAWHAFALMHRMEYGRRFDDRPGSDVPADVEHVKPPTLAPYSDPNTIEPRIWWQAERPADLDPAVGAERVGGLDAITRNGYLNVYRGPSGVLRFGVVLPTVQAADKGRSVMGGRIGIYHPASDTWIPRNDA